MNQAEIFNDYGRRHGYPIFVFSDGTFASYRKHGKDVIYEVPGPITMTQPQLAAPANKPARYAEKKEESFLGKLGKWGKQIFHPVPAKPEPPKTERNNSYDNQRSFDNHRSYEPEDVDYEEISEDPYPYQPRPREGSYQRPYQPRANDYQSRQREENYPRQREESYQRPYVPEQPGRYGDFMPDAYGTGRGDFHHKSGDVETHAHGVREAKTYHAKQKNPEGSEMEVFVANYRF